jgi:hypothetical protein
LFRTLFHHPDKHSHRNIFFVSKPVRKQDICNHNYQ